MRLNKQLNLISMIVYLIGWFTNKILVKAYLITVKRLIVSEILKLEQILSVNEALKKGR